MDLGGEGVSVYAEAKSEYTTQLCQYLVPSIQQYFLDLLEDAKQKETEPKHVLVMFQTLLEGISEWNADKVQRETTLIATKSRCDYLDELMTAVFIAHTKVLSAIRLTTKQKKLQITIPKLEHFLHRTLTECARLLWSNTYLFSTSAPTIERQKNLRLIENMLHEGVLQGIRGMLPVKSILREYLKEDAEEEEEEEDKEEPKKEEEEKEEKEEPKKEEKEEPKKEEKEEPKEEPKKEPKKEEKEEPKEEKKPKKEEKVSQLFVDVSEENAPVEIVFTGNDTLSTEIKENKPEPIATSDAMEGEDTIQIIDEPPAALDEFEDIESNDSFLPMDFEELS
jgi:hypothetical protein